MARIKLAVSPVVFHEAEHTYELGDVQLSGITSIIHKYLFPDMYKGLEGSKVLKDAADHGHLVHAQIQAIVNEKWGPAHFLEHQKEIQPEIWDYLRLMKENKIKMYCSEYLVSDNMFVASSIDLIDRNLNLYDIKTTSSFNREYVRWQLSIYAYLFELQNPGLTAGKLYGIHLRDGKAVLHEVERIQKDIVRELIYGAYASGNSTFDNPLNYLGDDESNLMAQLQVAMESKKYWEGQEKMLKAELNKRMKDRGTYAVAKDFWKVTRTPDTYGKKLDEDALKKSNPKIWRRFLKDSKTSGSLKITFSKNED